MRGDLTATTVEITGAGGDEIEAYLARPDGDGPRGGVVVIHHMPGYDRATKEIVRRFAELGLRRDLPEPATGREAPGAAPDDAAAAVRAPTAACPTSGWSATSAGRRRTCGRCRRRTARSASSATARAGGSPSWPRATSTLDAAVDCYGAFVTGTPPAGLPLQGHEPRRTSCRTCAARCSACSATRTSTRAPSRSPSSTEILDRARQAARVPHATTTPGTRSSPSTGRPTGVAAANDGWERIAAFYGHLLAGRS